ncbi:FtsW/RodA/SpoVE family cell cycle protein [Bacillus spongiae]|uniref:FtsW/RodA/SpoVE family cell cycle protein n=1 Tax=Bacillus spongiae TaxID=2683610 RepID=A0ABU8H8P2_9BACI
MEKEKYAYLAEVTEQIRSKEAKEFVSAELEHHLQNAKKAWLEKGVGEEEAEAKAVEQMGNPRMLGQQLNQLHRPKIDWWMMVLFISILGISILPMMISGGVMESGSYTKRKIFYNIIGFLTIISLMYMDYRKLRKYGRYFGGIGVVILLAISFFPTTLINGSPFLVIGSLTVSSYYALPFLFLFWSAYLNDKNVKIWKCLMIFISTLLLFFLQASEVGAFLYAVMVFGMVWFSDLNKRKLIGVTIAFFVTTTSCFFLFWFYSAGYHQRLQAFLNPERYQENEGYMYILVQGMMKNAGWFGSNATNVPQRSSHTDLVFVNFTYYYGWLFAAVLAAMLLLLFGRMLLIFNKIHDPFGRMLIVGGAVLFSEQVLYNFSMTIGVLPIISIWLPFISYGFIPTLLNSFIVGIILSIYRRKDIMAVSQS